MSYLVLARKYRPTAFGAVSGQDHVTKTLGNSILRDKVAHAILLTGPRGVGKTSIARIFSKCLNCVEGPTITPCLECTNCKEIAAGNSIAVREIDGASHNSVDNVRELIESFRSLPAPGSRYKVYIIDEVHMLSTSAFNALLKSLEEPPPHTVFILATTEAHKIPETVLSRCQRHDLRALNASVIEERLQFICREEGLLVEPGVLRMVARLAEGSMRDAQSILERLQAYATERCLTLSDAATLLGATEKTALFQISHAILSRDVELSLKHVETVLSTGVDVAVLIRDFVSHFRELQLAKLGGERALTVLGFLDDDKTELLRQAGLREGIDIQDLASLAREGGDGALRSSFTKYAFESLVVRMATREPIVDVAKLVARIEAHGIALVPGSSQQPKGGVSGSPPKGYERTARGSAQRGDESRPPHQSGSGGGSSIAFEWQTFVRFVSDSGARMLAEQLKRMALASFSGDVIELRGPMFCLSYLEQKENRTKLEGAVRNFLGNDSIKVILKEGEHGGSAAHGSILDMEQMRKQQSKREKEGEVLNHPHVQKIQDLFPGSTVEIKVKDR